MTKVLDDVTAVILAGGMGTRLRLPECAETDDSSRRASFSRLADSLVSRP